MLDTHLLLAHIDSIPDPHVCHGPIITFILITSHTCHVRVFISLHTGMMLKGNTTLKELYLKGCGLEPEGLEEVMKGVEVNTKLETLYLSKNFIDNKRASCLGKNDIIR